MTEFVIEILDGDRAGEVVPLEKNQLTVGRRAGNDLVLDDEKVSGKHAIIAFEEGNWIVRDLGSTNGTLMDGRRVEEVGLTANDIFQLGRIRVAFKEKGAPTPTMGGDLSVRRVDQATLARTGRRGGGVGLLLLVLALASGGAYYFLYLRGDDADGGAGPRTKSPLQVAGNLLRDGAGALEDDEGWRTAVSGVGFQAVSSRRGSHTGAGHFAAAVDPDASTATHHALARTATELRVAQGSGLRASAFFKTEGDAQAALRLRFWSSDDTHPLVLFTGTAPVSAATYTEVELEVGVPAGCDRVAVELLALLPDAACSVAVDDVALVNHAGAKSPDVQVGGQRVTSCCGALVVQDGEQVVIESIRPVPNGPGLVELDKAGLLCLSDAGRRLEMLAASGSVQFKVTGGPGIRLHVGRGLVANGVLVRQGGEPFVNRGEGFDLAGADNMLMGYKNARVMVRLAQPGPAVGALAAGGFDLTLPDAAEFSLVSDFSTQRDKARGLLEDARRAESNGKYEAVLDHLEELIAKYPHDDGLATDAATLRTGVRNRLSDRVRELENDLDKAVYFASLRGYTRIRTELDELVQTYGQKHLLQPDKIAAMQKTAGARITKIQRERGIHTRSKLALLAGIYGDSPLGAMIKRYTVEELPSPEPAQPDTPPGKPTAREEK